MSKVSTNAARSFIHRTPRRENNTVVTVQNNFSKMFLHGNQIAWHAEGGRIGLSMCGLGYADDARPAQRHPRSHAVRMAYHPARWDAVRHRSAYW